jgi:predicted nuclease of predicted toxin-antitoxin system
MKILLDENLPKQLKADFGPDYDVKTVQDMGWLGKKNGELLGLIVFNGFDFFVTIDKNLRYQQNLDRIELKIFLLLAVNNRRETLQALVEKIKDKIQEGNLQKLNEVS